MALLLALGAAAPARGEEGAASLESFLDEVVPAQLATYRIPGATVAVVRGGRLELARGYGYADAERRTPVVAERTLFRVASLGKPFIWTAVMQLVEQGRLELDADIRTYLEEVPVLEARPLTLAHLMAHTAGRVPAPAPAGPGASAGRAVLILRLRHAPGRAHRRAGDGEALRGV
ncbi:MAG TPA: serine hydrolase domain-containing protein, partial [Myxococcaceae bacterium]|nr:serine hydrolase domain-containing protein [Myxococcaceae bacterium]